MGGSILPLTLDAKRDLDFSGFGSSMDVDSTLKSWNHCIDLFCMIFYAFGVVCSLVRQPYNLQANPVGL